MPFATADGRKCKLTSKTSGIEKGRCTASYCIYMVARFNALGRAGRARALYRLHVP